MCHAIFVSKDPHPYVTQDEKMQCYVMQRDAMYCFWMGALLCDATRCNVLYWDRGISSGLLAVGYDL